MKITLTAENAKTNEFCMDAQAELIYGPEILDHFTTNDLEDLVPIWTNSLRSGGKIVLGGTDLYILCKSVLNRNVELSDVNRMLFHRDAAIKSITSIESTKAFLTSMGFTITNILFNHSTCTYCVEAFKE